MAEQRGLNAGLILVADDEPRFREAFAEMLNLRGYETVLASSQDEVRQCVGRRQFDLLTLDLSWDHADYNGIDILREVLRLDSNLPVVMLTSQGSIPTAVEATRLGAFDYIEKALEREKTLVMIKNAVEAGRLRRENAAFLRELRAKFEIVGESPAIRRLREQIRKVGPSDSVVLITGPSGTGKQLVARQIHYHSPRREKAFVCVDSGTLTETLAESELFGHKKGAFTGASQDRAGLVAEAEGGTLFLDEIANASLSLQAKLLHLLQEREYRHVGEDRMTRCNVRILAASNKSLPDLVRAGQFREDLYYRLKVVEFDIPPLRDRKEDIASLVDHFLNVKSRQCLGQVKTITVEARALMLDHMWPGNVRELENTIERLVIMSEHDEITLDDFCAITGRTDPAGAPTRSLHEMTRQFKRECVMKAMTLADGNVSRAAEILQVDRTHLHRLIRDFELVESR